MDVDTALYIATEFDVEMKKVSKLQKEIRHCKINNKTYVKILKKKDEEIKELKEKNKKLDEELDAKKKYELDEMSELYGEIKELKDEIEGWKEIYVDYADGSAKALTFENFRQYLDDEKEYDDEIKELKEFKCSIKDILGLDFEDADSLVLNCVETREKRYEEVLDQNKKLEKNRVIMDKCKKVWYEKCQESIDDDPDAPKTIKWSICLEGALNYYSNQNDELKEEIKEYDDVAVALCGKLKMDFKEAKIEWDSLMSDLFTDEEDYYNDRVEEGGSSSFFRLEYEGFEMKDIPTEELADCHYKSMRILTDWFESKPQEKLIKEEEDDNVSVASTLTLPSEDELDKKEDQKKKSKKKKSKKKSKKK